MKKTIFKLSTLGLISLIALSGCGGNSDKTKASETSESKITATTETKENTSASSTSTESSSTKSSESRSESTKDSQASTEESKTESQTPYAVDLAKLDSTLTFNLKGMNVPKTITLNQGGTPSVTFPNDQKYTATIATVPTKEIRLFSHDGNAVRTVKVNTQITLSGSDEQHNGEILYLFNNANGGLSLATPNYAGNVTADQADVMLEAVR